MKSGLGPGSRP